MDWVGSFECMCAFIGYGSVWCVLLGCVFGIAFVCAWNEGDISGGG